MANPIQDVQELASENPPERSRHVPIERKDPIHDRAACLHKELGDPLAVISITSHNLRRNLEAGDSDMAAALYRIERSVRRRARIMWEFSGGPVQLACRAGVLGLQAPPPSTAWQPAAGLVRPGASSNRTAADSDPRPARPEVCARASGCRARAVEFDARRPGLCFGPSIAERMLL